MRDISWKTIAVGAVKYSDNASAFTSEHLKCGWILLSHCSLGPLRIPIVLLRPDGGVALFELPPAWTEDLPARFRQGLARAGFSAAYPGHLPVIHRRLRPEDIPHLDSILHEAFAFEDPIGIPPSSDWADVLQAMLAMAPPKAPVAKPPALRRPLVPALLACAGAAACWLLWPAARQAEMPPSLPRLISAPPVLPVPLENAAIPPPVPQTGSAWPRWTATALAGAPATEILAESPAQPVISALSDLEAVPSVPADETVGLAVAWSTALAFVAAEDGPPMPVPALVALRDVPGWDPAWEAAVPPALVAVEPAPLLPKVESAPDMPAMAPLPRLTIAQWMIPEFVRAETPASLPADLAAPWPPGSAEREAVAEGPPLPAQEGTSATEAALTPPTDLSVTASAERPSSSPEASLAAEQSLHASPVQPPQGTTSAADAPLPAVAVLTTVESTAPPPLPEANPAAMTSPAAPVPLPSVADSAPSPAAAATTIPEAPPPAPPAPQAATGPVASAGPAGAPPPARPVPDPPVSAQPAVAEPALVSAMLRRAEVLLSFGDISGARRFLERAEAAGSASAAVALAETYDPATLASLHTRGLRADPAAALAWYRRAAARGAPVSQRIQALEAP